MSKFEIGSQWKTRGGWRAVVVDAGQSAFDGTQVIDVWHKDGASGGQSFMHLAENGRYATGADALDSRDLIEEWVEPIVHEGWLNMYKGYPLYDTQDEANSGADFNDRIACIKVKFTEGEGL